MSTYNHYLEQKEGLVKNPHGTGGGMRSGVNSIPKELEELLYTGTADEYEGIVFQFARIFDSCHGAVESSKREGKNRNSIVLACLLILNFNIFSRRFLIKESLPPPAILNRAHIIYDRSVCLSESEAISDEAQRSNTGARYVSQGIFLGSRELSKNPRLGAEANHGHKR